MRRAADYGTRRLRLQRGRDEVGHPSKSTRSKSNQELAVLRLVHRNQLAEELRACDGIDVVLVAEDEADGVTILEAPLEIPGLKFPEREVVPKLSKGSG